MEERLNKRLRFTLVLAVFGNLLVVAVIVAGITIISKLAAEIRSANTRATVSLNRPEKINQLRSDYEALEPDIPLLESALPENRFESLLPVTTALSNLAARFNVSATTNFLSDIPATSTSGQPYLTFSVQFRAQLTTLDEYLAALEKLPFFIEIESLSITDSININGLSNVKITARLYVRAP